MTEKKNGCFDRKLFVEKYLSGYNQVIKNFSFKEPCKYRLSDLGKADKKCNGCKWKEKND